MHRKCNPVGMQRGTTLLEVLVVSFIVVTALVALASLTFVSLGRNRQTKDMVVATRLAQEGIEWFKSQRLANGFDSVATEAVILNGLEYCLKDIQTDSDYNSVILNLNDGCRLENGYYRWFTMENSTSPGAEVVTITVYVSRAGVNLNGDQPVTLVGKIYKWQR